MKEQNEKSQKKSSRKQFRYYYGSDNAKVGFDMIPRAIFDKQVELDLSDGELNIFLHFLNGLSKGRKSIPFCYQTLQSPRYLSNKTGKSQRQISRAIKGLNEKGFIEPIKEYKAAGGAMIRSHNIEPGIKKIMAIAKKMRKEKKENDKSFDSIPEEDLVFLEDDDD